MDKKEPILITSHHNKQIIIGIQNDSCKWRASTLLTKEPETIKWLQKIKRNEIFWDVGANIGLYSVFASIMTGCRTYAFEPESQNYSVLNKNILFNKLEKLIRAYCIGISNVTEVNSLQLSKLEAGYSGHSLGTSSNKFNQGCISFSIDDLIDLGIPCPNHLKIDIDGLEHLVLQGARKNINNINSVLVEIDQKNTKHLQIIEDMKMCGFVYNEKQVEKTGLNRGKNFENYREYIFRRPV